MNKLTAIARSFANHCAKCGDCRNGNYCSVGLAYKTEVATVTLNPRPKQRQTFRRSYYKGAHR